MCECLPAAETHNVCLVLANDPDADRLAVSERKDSYSSVPAAADLKDATALYSSDKERWRPLSGNEIGVLLAHWLWTQKLQVCFARPSCPALAPCGFL
jgi:phosphoglucomutase